MSGFGICMLIRMRTTLVLDDGLLTRAKQRAAERQMTVSDIVNEALRESLDRRVQAAAPFNMVTYGRAHVRVRHEPIDLDAALETEGSTSAR